MTSLLIGIRVYNFIQTELVSENLFNIDGIGEVRGLAWRGEREREREENKR